MIHIEDKRKCVGCNGCASVCPTNCIELRADDEGFFYPVVDVLKCIDCGLCERVCPVLVQDDEREPLSTYAAVNQDNEIRGKSSSGGIFTPLAESVIADGGIVFGAVFNKRWEVVHAAAHNVDELASMRGSKYVQSEIGECYKLAKKYLGEERKVLFTGTPCQIAGLRRYLRKEYSNLICVDIICHGVPSPAVFKTYISEQSKRLGFDIKDIKNINFRDKRNGWHDSRFVCRYVTKLGESDIVQPLSQNLYFKGFIRDLYLRPSCHACPSKKFKSGSDITIADLWGVENITPELDDNQGVSLICINSEIGQYYFNKIKKETKFKKIALTDALEHNQSAYSSAIEHGKRKKFFAAFGKEPFHSIITRLLKRTLLMKIKYRLKNLFKY